MYPDHALLRFIKSLQFTTAAVAAAAVAVGEMTGWCHCSQHCGAFLMMTDVGRWQRVTIALPPVAVTQASQFRWYQSSSSSVPWAIDESKIIKIILFLH